MNQNLKEKILESKNAVLPITVIVLLLTFLLLPMDNGTVILFLVGAVLLTIGMGIFQLGAEISMTPLGEGVGVQLSKSRNLFVIVLVSFVMGLFITIAEPDLQVLSNQVPSIPNQTLILTIAVGVGIFLSVAILRIILKIKLSIILAILYAAIFLLALFVPADLLAVGFDAGGVTTGPITVPFIMAMGIGLASARGDKDAAGDSFGLVALSSIGPILAVMVLSIFYNTSDASYSSSVIPELSTTKDVLGTFFHAFPIYGKEVLVALVPLLILWLLFQVITRRFPPRQLGKMLVGYIYTYLGLVMFLTGVNVGFMPVGQLFGSQLATSHKWLLIPLGMLIGYFIVKAEPAVQVLNHQVDEVTNGAISSVAMNRCLSIGVAISVGLSMSRIIWGINIMWFLIPGYVIAIVLSRFVPPIFVGIGFDSGGVASGPMTTTFLLPLAMGACEAVGGNVMTDAFGVVAMVAMTPLIAIQIMGAIFLWKQKKEKLTSDEMDGTNNDIIEF